MKVLAELQRRNVFRVAAAYLALGWVVTEVASTITPLLNLPVWLPAVLVWIGILGFPFILAFAWVYELTPEGLKRESEVAREDSVTRQTGRRLDLITIAMIVVAVGLLIADRYLLDGTQVTPASTSTSSAPVVAVLPFKATGSDDGGFLASGLHDDLLSRLAKLRAFRVISRTSVMEYAATTKNLRQIGEELGARYILEGGVQALAGRVRINAQLIDAPADEHLWAEIYDRELTATDLFDVQAELAGAIAVQMQTTLTDSDRAVIDAVPTRNIEAYNAYLRGLKLYDEEGMAEPALRAGLAALEQAVGLDPQFALAWAQLSMQRSRLAQVTRDTASGAAFGEAARAAYDRARALQPDLAEIELARAEYRYRVLFEYEQALQALEALEARSPLSASALMLKAYLLRRLGRIGESYRTALEAQTLDPRSVSTTEYLIYAAYENDDCAAAEQHVRAALALAPQQPAVRVQVANYELECTGDADRASELLADVDFQAADSFVLWTAREAAQLQRDGERMLELADMPRPGDDPFNDVFDQLSRSVALEQLGRDEEVKATLDRVAERLAELEQGNEGQGEAYAGARAWYNAMRGDADETRDWVEEHRRRFRQEQKGDKAEETYNHLGYARNLASVGLREEAIAELRVMLEEPGGHRFPFVDADPVFDSLKDHPDYIELRQR